MEQWEPLIRSVLKRKAPYFRNEWPDMTQECLLRLWQTDLRRTSVGKVVHCTIVDYQRKHRLIRKQNVYKGKKVMSPVIPKFHSLAAAYSRGTVPSRLPTEIDYTKFDESEFEFICRIRWGHPTSARFTRSGKHLGRLRELVQLNLNKEELL